MSRARLGGTHLSGLVHGELQVSSTRGDKQQDKLALVRCQAMFQRRKQEPGRLNRIYSAWSNPARLHKKKPLRSADNETVAG
jgi:hypothetical protein